MSQPQYPTQGMYGSSQVPMTSVPTQPQPIPSSQGTYGASSSSASISQPQMMAASQPVHPSSTSTQESSSVIIQGLSEKIKLMEGTIQQFEKKIEGLEGIIETMKRSMLEENAHLINRIIAMEAKLPKESVGGFPSLPSQVVSSDKIEPVKEDDLKSHVSTIVSNQPMGPQSGDISSTGGMQSQAAEYVQPGRIESEKKMISDPSMLLSHGQSTNRAFMSQDKELPTAPEEFGTSGEWQKAVDAIPSSQSYPHPEMPSAPSIDTTMVSMGVSGDMGLSLAGNQDTTQQQAQLCKESVAMGGTGMIVSASTIQVPQPSIPSESNESMIQPLTHEEEVPSHSLPSVPHMPDEGAIYPDISGMQQPIAQQATMQTAPSCHLPPPKIPEDVPFYTEEEAGDSSTPSVKKFARPPPFIPIKDISEVTIHPERLSFCVYAFSQLGYPNILLNCGVTTDLKLDFGMIPVKQHIHLLNGILDFLPNLPMLSSFVVSRVSLDPDLCRKLAKMLDFNRNLSTLAIIYCNIGCEGIVAISSVLYRLTKLNKFFISGNPIGSSGLAAICGGLRGSKSIRCVNVVDCEGVDPSEVSSVNFKIGISKEEFSWTE
eukprot:gnl/Carplike_NY0171/3607_a4875_434.p1 GENE.gnl/Carplike_NY0171/3607_a4875_434~~gnl/Carplike_NY0171/3607_a4875_434.p1  ORF type:complete len:639 (+),score=151.76 gnl/Carplike_NY0171/3607_a4875_434:120-1919(+)